MGGGRKGVSGWKKGNSCEGGRCHVGDCGQLDFLLFLKQWMNMNTIKDVDHFNINHERLNKNRNMGHFNFKHERLNNNSWILTPCLSYLDFLLFFKQWININYNEKCGPF